MPLETLVQNIKYVRSFLLADEKSGGTKKIRTKSKDVEEFGGVRRILLAERAVEEQKEREIKEREREKRKTRSPLFSRQTKIPHRNEFKIAA